MPGSVTCICSSSNSTELPAPSTNTSSQEPVPKRKKLPLTKYQSRGHQPSQAVSTYIQTTWSDYPRLTRPPLPQETDEIQEWVCTSMDNLGNFEKKISGENPLRSRSNWNRRTRNWKEKSEPSKSVVNIFPRNKLCSDFEWSERFNILYLICLPEFFVIIDISVCSQLSVFIIKYLVLLYNLNTVHVIS